MNTQHEYTNYIEYDNEFSYEERKSFSKGFINLRSNRIVESKEIRENNEVNV